MDTVKRYYRKRVEFFRLLQKMKLWPSRKGILHGIKTFEIKGNQAMITTHCNETFLAYNSKNSRAARFLRNKWNFTPCPTCRVPSWKLDKYSSTRFSQSYGSDLTDNES
ncbi:MAG: pyrrolysine--tRNA(Pyl) ligase small subunit [Bacillota bacterium]|nr:pyrrolysine--tRNA(Pyl) ligase small subunit [Bacillota bacterium]